MNVRNRITVPVPLENGMAYLDLPLPITTDDAERLGRVVDALVIDEPAAPPDPKETQ